MTFDPQVFERIACALETIADAQAVRETRYCRLLAMDKFAYVRGDEVVGAFWRLTFLYKSDATSFELDICVKHPDDPQQVLRGRELLQQLGEAVGMTKGDTRDIVGMHFALSFVGTRIVGIFRDDVVQHIEARKLPPPDMIDFGVAISEYYATTLDGIDIEPDPLSLD